MNSVLSFLFAFFLALPAFAGFQGYNGTTSLNTFNKLQCSTGLTCTKVGDKFKIVSSPTISTGSLSIEAAEAGNAILMMSADESDDNGDDWRLMSAASGTFTIANDTSGSQVAKFTLATSGNVTFTGSLTGHKQNQIAATATTLTSAQCGSTVINSGAVEVELPEASTVLGCQYTFIVGNASNFVIDPDAADSIVLLTNAAGDSITADAVGESVTIEAISASAWAPVGAEKGTWSDTN